MSIKRRDKWPLPAAIPKQWPYPLCVLFLYAVKSQLSVDEEGKEQNNPVCRAGIQTFILAKKTVTTFTPHPVSIPGSL